jgi:hypothetical protein
MSRKLAVQLPSLMQLVKPASEAPPEPPPARPLSEHFLRATGLARGRDAARLAALLAEGGAELAAELRWRRAEAEVGGDAYPLLAAAESGSWECARLLLCDAHAPVHVRDELGNTALHVAVARGHAGFVRELLALHPELMRWRNEADAQALHPAARAGHVAIVEALLAAGAELCPPHARGSSPLLEAVRRGHASVVAVLLRAGAEPGPARADAMPPLLAACMEDDAVVADVLLAHGADPDQGWQGLLPLVEAASRDRFKLVSLLLAAGADPCRRDRRRCAPLDAVHSPMVRQLLLRGTLLSRLRGPLAASAQRKGLLGAALGTSPLYDPRVWRVVGRIVGREPWKSSA